MERTAEDRSTGPERTLWLVRHGESTWNALGLVQGHAGEPTLTDRGSAQAHRAARQLAGRPIGSVYSSDLQRAVQTARAIADAFELGVVQDVRFRERCLGVAEGTQTSALGSDQSGISDGRVVDPDAAPSGGESVRQLCRRVAAFVRELRWSSAGGDRRTGDVVVVAHGGVVRAALAHLDGVEPGRMAWGPIGNGLVVPRPLVRPLARTVPRRSLPAPTAAN